MLGGAAECTDHSFNPVFFLRTVKLSRKLKTTRVARLASNSTVVPPTSQRHAVDHRETKRRNNPLFRFDLVEEAESIHLRQMLKAVLLVPCEGEWECGGHLGIRPAKGPTVVH